MGVTAPSTTWFLAEGATGMFSSGCWSGNPNDAPAHVTLTYLLDIGRVIVRTRDMAPEQPADRARADARRRTRPTPRSRRW